MAVFIMFGKYTHRGLEEISSERTGKATEMIENCNGEIKAIYALLGDHDIVVFMHPFFWYSTPAILKEWQDLVLQHGWAYGSQGTALRGKRMLSAITTGGRESSYQPDGHNRYTIRQLLAPIEQTARLCGMEYLPPFVVHGTHELTREDILEHARGYRRFLEAARDDRLDLEAARKQTRVNADLDAVIQNGTPG